MLSWSLNRLSPTLGTKASPKREQVMDVSQGLASALFLFAVMPIRPSLFVVS